MIIDVRIFDMSFNGENLGSDLNYGPGVSFWARLVLKTRFEINGSDSELQKFCSDVSHYVSHIAGHYES